MPEIASAKKASNSDFVTRKLRRRPAWQNYRRGANANVTKHDEGNDGNDVTNANDVVAMAVKRKERRRVFIFLTSQPSFKLVVMDQIFRLEM